jgi:hypothetical protein
VLDSGIFFDLPTSFVLVFRFLGRGGRRDSGWDLMFSSLSAPGYTKLSAIHECCNSCYILPFIIGHKIADRSQQITEALELSVETRILYVMVQMQCDWDPNRRIFQ